jgi:hypothetical protein
MAMIFKNRTPNQSMLRNKLTMLRQSQARGAWFDMCTWDHEPRNPVFQDFLRLLHEHDWCSDIYRWDIGYDEDPDGVIAYWQPKTVVLRPANYVEALRCARYVHRCERLMSGSPWPQALNYGVVHWIMDGIMAGPQSAAGSD